MQTQAFAAGGLLWSSADANHDNISDYKPNGLQVTGDTTTRVAEGAQLEAETISLFATIPVLHATSQAGAESFVVLLVGVSKSYADAFVFLNVLAQTIVETGTSRRTLVTGLRGVDIRAVIDDLVMTREASRLGVGIIPPQGALAGACDPNRNNYNRDDKCFDGLEHFTKHADYVSGVNQPTAKALVEVGKNVTVTAGARETAATLEAGTSTPLTSRNSIALYVQSTVKTFGDVSGEYHLWTDYLPGSSGIGEYDGRLSDPTNSAPINWDADVGHPRRSPRQPVPRDRRRRQGEGGQPGQGARTPAARSSRRPWTRRCPLDVPNGVITSSRRHRQHGLRRHP